MPAQTLRVMTSSSGYLKRHKSSGWLPSLRVKVFERDRELRQVVLKTMLEFSDVISIGGYGKTNHVSHSIILELKKTLPIVRLNGSCSLKINTASSLSCPRSIRTRKLRCWQTSRAYLSVSGKGLHVGVQEEEARRAVRGSKQTTSTITLFFHILFILNLFLIETRE